MLLTEDDDEIKMFFEDPDQVEKIFQEWEEKNLFLISNSKDR